MNTCQHCHIHKADRPRGLCRVCYYIEPIRSMYPSTSKFARRGNGADVTAPPLPEPTPVQPGPQKVEVMEARAARGEQIFNPLDGLSGDTLQHLSRLLNRARHRD